MIEQTPDAEIGRVPSYIPGLDTVLCGGFLSGGLYLFQGQPGAGKTILASQILYNHAAHGARALFITVLGENHGRMMAHLRPMRFFDQSFVPDRVSYISAYQALDEDTGDLKSLTTLLRRELQSSEATLMVLDGLSAVQAKASSIFAMKRFTHELQTLASVTDCTVFLLTTDSGTPSEIYQTMVDGVIELRPRRFASRTERRLVVTKIRGSNFLEGEHAYRIAGDGVSVFPRVEAQFLFPTRPARESPSRLSSGIPSLDILLQGGLHGATQASVVGPSGAGKTTAGLQYLSNSSASEPGLLFGCFETPERLRVKADAMGFRFTEAERKGDLELLWHPVGEHILDEIAHKLLDRVRHRGVKRLVIDGILGFQQSGLEPERMLRFWSALSAELRALGVTTLNTMEQPELIGAELRVPINGISPLSESLILLRYVELRSKVCRLISVFKMRDGPFDSTIREFNITDKGIVVGEPFLGTEAILSGIARETAVTRADPNVDRSQPR